MNLKMFLPNLQANAETLLLGTALHYATSGSIDTKHLDTDATAIALFALLDQIEQNHPGTAQKYGWARMSDLAALGQSLEDAALATTPSGLK